jgi:saxitoxin biosynthesis operon SxtJ-like protein
MALLEINWNPDRRELRQFAVLCVVIFGLIGVDCLLRRGSLPAAAIFEAIAAAGVVGYFRPSFLRPVYVAWMAVAWPIGWTVSHLLLLLVYYLVLTPIGLVMRLFGYDPLNRRFDRSVESYWTPHDPGAEASRYFKQF